MKQQPHITTVEQLIMARPDTCTPALKWLAGCGITDLADAWDWCHRGDWMLWLCGALDLLDDRERRLIACKCVRETPLIDGHKVWDLLTDERSRQAVVVAERYADGEATDEELAAVALAASAAEAYAARAAARAVAYAVARDAAASVAAEMAVDAAMTYACAYADADAFAARAAAREAQADFVREIAGNPFRDSVA